MKRRPRPDRGLGTVALALLLVPQLVTAADPRAARPAVTPQAIAAPPPPPPPAPPAPDDPSVLREHALSVENTARRDRSVMALQQAASAWRAALEKAPSDELRVEAQRHIDELDGLVQHLRQRRVLDSARDRRNAGRCADALPRYDEYLKEAPLSPERTTVQAERAECERLGSDTEGRDSRRKWAGGVLLVAGLAAGAAGIGLWTSAGDLAAEARSAPTLNDSLAKADSVHTRETAAAVLGAVGGVAAVVGIITLAVGREARDARTASVWVSPTGNGLAVGGRF